MLSTHSSSAGTVLRKIEPIEADGLDLATRGRMRNAEAVKLMLAARRKTDHELESPRALRADELTRSIANHEKRIFHAPRAEGARLMQAFEECAHLRGNRFGDALDRKSPRPTQRVPCSMLLKMNSARRRAGKYRQSALAALPAAKVRGRTLDARRRAHRLHAY